VQRIQQLFVKIKSNRLPGWVRLIPVIVLFLGIACNGWADVNNTVTLPPEAIATLEAQFDIKAFYDKAIDFIDSYLQADEFSQELLKQCNNFKVTFLNGIANGPVNVYWTGAGSNTTSYNATLVGAYNGIKETYVGSGMGPLLGGVTFPIDSTLAHAIVDNGGYFKVDLTISGTFNSNIFGEIRPFSCSGSLVVNTGDMSTTVKTPVPTVQPTAQSSNNNRVEPTPQPAETQPATAPATQEVIATP
jgi:hypothetical protein